MSGRGAEALRWRRPFARLSHASRVRFPGVTSNRKRMVCVPRIFLVLIAIPVLANERSSACLNPCSNLGVCSLLRDFSGRWRGPIDAKFARHHRTFERRHRHIGVGDFSAQYLNGRRRARILRLRGVALFRTARISSRRTSRPETGSTARRDDCRWQLWEVCRRPV